MKRKNTITTILWDVDGTLLDFPYSQRYAITKSFQSVGREVTDEMINRFSQINDDYWKRLELGEVTKSELLTGRFITLFEEYGVKGVDLDDFCMEFQSALGSVYLHMDDSLTLCTSLKDRFRQYVVTNGVASTQRQKLKLSGLGDVMEDIFISEEIGYPKPHREFFDKCMQQISEKNKKRILIVGDSISSDIKGGIGAGILTCWYRPDETQNNTIWKPDYEISHLNEVYDILHIFEK